MTQVVLVVKNLPAKAGDIDMQLHPWVGKIPGGGHGKPLQYSCLENPMDRGAGGLQSVGLQSRTGLKQISSSNICTYVVNLLSSLFNTAPQTCFTICIQVSI